ncbi:MAG: hypothetical protein KA205_04745 [Acidobacteria bacterium]|nr:hypothetical protein [Acidobacteriota bacterium]
MSRDDTVGATTPLVGAFEADAWAGLVFVVGPERGLSLRLAVECDGQRYEPRDLFICAREIGPCAPDGHYARVAFDLTLSQVEGAQAPIRADAESERTLTWEWARLDAHTVAIRLSAVRQVTATLECAVPWQWRGEWHPWPLGAAGWAGRERDPDQVDPDVVVRVVSGEASPARPLQFEMATRPVVLLVTLAAHGEAAARTQADVSAAIDRASSSYEAWRPHVSGAWQGLAASVANNVHWMVLLQPEHRRRYAPAGRRWIFPRETGGRDDWTIFAWDGYFNALLLSLESPALAREMLASVNATQYASGNVPNWRGRHHGTPDRSQPPVGAFVALKLAQRTGDLTQVAESLPVLDRWHAWWERRRRPSGLYAWGSTLSENHGWVPSWEREATHRQKAAWESGQDDLPNWDDAEWDDATGTLAMDCVDLSALRALDAECLAHLHELAGDAGLARAYRDEHARLCALIREHLWDDARGVFADRRADGCFSTRVAASNFFPLLAGAASGWQTTRALATLLDPERFWGTWIVPTIDRQDPAFRDQQYWRGTIWPPTNFLIYEALRRARADEAASTLASRSVALFLRDWHDHQVCRENFSAIDGGGGGQRHQSWGPLFSWVGLAEFIDVTPWDGVRIGSVTAEATSRAERLRVSGREWDITLGQNGMRVACDGRALMTADGMVCLRHTVVSPGGWCADATVRRQTRVTCGNGTSATLAPGTTRLECPF